MATRNKFLLILSCWSCWCYARTPQPHHPANIPDPVQQAEQFKDSSDKYYREGYKDQAYSLLLQSAHLSDSLKSTSLVRNLDALQVHYNIPDKNKQIENLMEEIALSKARFRTNSFLLAGVCSSVVFILAMSLFIYAGRQNRKPELIPVSQKLKPDGALRYAGNLRNYFNPDLQMNEGVVKDLFVYSKLKNKISGDFCWRIERGTETWYAVVDCSGEGIPSSLLGMIGNVILKRILHDEALNEPGEVLTTLNQELISLMQNGRKEIHDGIDICLCRLNPETRELCYAGTYKGMAFIRGEELRPMEFRGPAIGYDKLAIYNQTSLRFRENDTVYLFTNGFAVQNGGSENKKFMSSKLRYLFSRIASFPMKEQEAHLNNTFLQWIEEREQRDDVLVLGLRLS